VTEPRFKVGQRVKFWFGNDLYYSFIHDRATKNGVWMYQVNVGWLDKMWISENFDIQDALR
jgi:hypothetical protein